MCVEVGFIIFAPSNFKDNVTEVLLENGVKFNV